MMWGGGAGWGWGLIMTLVWVGLILAIVLLVVRSSPGSSPGGVGRDRRDAEDVLAERFARGEIDVEEYERRREVLRRNQG